MLGPEKCQAHTGEEEDEVKDAATFCDALARRHVVAQLLGGARNEPPPGSARSLVALLVFARFEDELQRERRNRGTEEKRERGKEGKRERGKEGKR